MNKWGVYTTRQLMNAGWTRDALTLAVQQGRLWRLRQGYYALPDADQTLKRIVRLGGQATATTALRLHSVWTPPASRDRMHAVLARTASRLSDPDERFTPFSDREDVHLHWQEIPPRRASLLLYTPVVPVMTAIEHMIGCADDEIVVACVDSALNKRLISPADIAALRAGLPAHHAALIDACDGRAEAGGESIARFRLRRIGLDLEIQVQVPGAGRLDIVVANQAALEIDGRQWHDNANAFAEDRRRDQVLATNRMPTVRVTYDDIWNNWARVERAVLGLLKA